MPPHGAALFCALAMFMARGLAQGWPQQPSALGNPHIIAIKGAGAEYHDLQENLRSALTAMVVCIPVHSVMSLFLPVVPVPPLNRH